MSIGAFFTSVRLGRRARAYASLLVAAATVVGGVNLLAAGPTRAATVGNGFVVTSGDLGFILKQIRIAERHTATRSATHPCDTLVGPAADQVPDRLTSYGLRTVDGSCNNLFPGRETFAAADQPFPRLAAPEYRDAEDGPGGPTSYKDTSAGNVVYDSQPRLISNLIVDQTSDNPAAVAATIPVRAQDSTPTAVPCSQPSVSTDPIDCVPPHKTLFIPNITTDTGLSPPFNSWFTFFGQFFDHGVDQTVKGGGTVIVPLRPDDPLITLGPDGKAGTGDEVPASRAFMPLTRARNQPGADGVLGTDDDVTDATNTDSPWVDQSQTYTSHPSHQVFLREYEMSTGVPRSTGKLLGGALDAQGRNVPVAAGVASDQGIATWKATKAQAKLRLGLLLSDSDVLDMPMVYADPYGQFIPGPNGLPQWMCTPNATDCPATGLVEGNLAAPVAAPSSVLRFDTPFLTDIAHNADPSPTQSGAAKTPDTDAAVNPDAAGPVAAGTYDDEGLGAHFVCGDGRCNENIALTAVHQIFHSEHDRLVDDITATLNKPENADLLAAYKASFLFDNGDGTGAKDISFGFGARLFQAARFVTEMEYQHLVFEEFGRKVQPGIRLFHVYSPDIDPSVDAEFAHAVYRFGHSMLDDTVARYTEDADGTKHDNSLPLLTAFLNPTEYFNSKDPNHPYNAAQAAGAIIMGSVDQTGNEIDEFVTETLRNNLIGLPLDLATLNLTRARDTGVPRLNAFRRAVFAKTNDGQLQPYGSWTEFRQALKHPESAVNFVAAYGTHPTILAETTVAGKRAAARAIVDPLSTDVIPEDAGDFMLGTGAWANVKGKPVTGLEDVDLWIGGLAEEAPQNGGLLGNTFNYVFQQQMEKLQDGDRLYYLARLPGLSLRTQIEGNSFSEIIERNTIGTARLKADPFATADCKFDLNRITFPAPAGSAITGSSSVADDPTSEDCNENLLLIRNPSDGRISYRATNTVDPKGINGQSVYRGTPALDRITGGKDNDTFWGDLGNDAIDGGNGDDVALGGEGNDILTDTGGGADVPKGGPGNDAIDAGIGDDIPMGNEGADVINGGAGDNETFAGPGNDWIIAGQGADTVFGDGGDDWIEGGSGQDLLQGDHGAPFFNDPGEEAPGNDVFIGQVGENDYDAEGGDDLMAQNAAIDRNAGAGGFDWAFHQYNTVPADDDMEINNNLGPLPVQVVNNRDRWQETEADSGSAFDDVIRGTTRPPATLAGAGFTGCNALDPDGVARIDGLNRYITTFPTALPPLVAASAANYCPLNGAAGTNGVGRAGNGQGFVWGEGNVLLGGDGSDLLEGRADDDVIDGDTWLRVRISVRTDPKDPATETGSTDLIEHPALTGTFGAGTDGMTLQEAVFAGLVDPGKLVAVREIVRPDGSLLGATPDLNRTSDCGTAAPKNCDVAMFTLPAANYIVTGNGDGSVTVTQPAVTGGGGGGGGLGGGGGAVTDGTDTLWNIELLRFCTARDVNKVCTAWEDQPVPARPVAPTAPIITGAVAGPARATVSFFPTSDGPFTGFEIDAITGGVVVQTVSTDGAASNAVISNLVNGASYTFVVRAVNAAGPSPNSLPSAVVVPKDVPTAPTIGTATLAGSTSATVTWSPSTGNGGSPILGYQVEALVGGLPQLVTSAGVTATSATVSGLDPGTTYTFWVRAVNAVGVSRPSAESNAVTTASTSPPPAPPAPAATPGNGQLTVTFAAPATGGPFTRFDVQVLRAGTTTQVGALRTAAASATSLVVTGLTNGTAYEVRVRAVNAFGAGAYSPRSASVTPASAPGAPVIGTATSGTAGGTINALVRWTRPTSDGGSPVTGYRVIALRMSSTSSTATVLQEVTSGIRPTTSGSYTMPLPVTGTYRFQVVAINAAGTSARSARSNAVTGR